VTLSGKLTANITNWNCKAHMKDTQELIIVRSGEREEQYIFLFPSYFLLNAGYWNKE
jgi:hypothetical protein